MTHFQGEREPTDANPEVTWMLEFSHKDFQAAILTMLNEVKENMLIELVKKKYKKQMEILEAYIAWNFKKSLDQRKQWRYIYRGTKIWITTYVSSKTMEVSRQH